MSNRPLMSGSGNGADEGYEFLDSDVDSLFDGPDDTGEHHRFDLVAYHVAQSI